MPSCSSKCVIVSPEDDTFLVLVFGVDACVYLCLFLMYVGVGVGGSFEIVSDLMERS